MQADTHIFTYDVTHRGYWDRDGWLFWSHSNRVIHSVKKRYAYNECERVRAGGKEHTLIHTHTQTHTLLAGGGWAPR